MNIFNVYVETMAFALIVILSYFFNYISLKTKIPSILFLIGLGIGVQALISKYEISLSIYIQELLDILGILGLIVIILEASFELKINREKKSLLILSFLSSVICLIFTTLGIAYLLSTFMIHDMIKSLFYAIPLGIISSEIVLPGVINLIQSKKEFLIYESTFSGILGIIVFYILVGSVEEQDTTVKVVGISGHIILTLIISLLVSYLLVWLLQWLKLKEKLFFLIAILVFLYSVGKMLNLSALLIILVFGLLLNNYSLFFRGKLQGLVQKNVLKSITDDFRVVTKETSFLIKTFFFVIFGMTLQFKEIYTPMLLYIVAGSLAVIYFVRFILLKAIFVKKFVPELWIAPRGFISVLLFFSIPPLFTDEGFNSIILLAIILATSLIMFSGLNLGKESQPESDELSFDNWDQLDEEIKILDGKDLKK